MSSSSLPPKAREVLFQDVLHRDLTTARRTALLELLWNERFLTRSQLIARIELKLGKDCFGKAAWEDNFYRDMRVVKQAFNAVGLHLAFSRKEQPGGYYLRGQPALSAQFSQLIKSSVVEVDQRQIDIYCRLSPADRFRQGCSISDTARRVVAYRILQANPGMAPAEANRLALKRAYSP
jgi:hypothetical protein